VPYTTSLTSRPFGPCSGPDSHIASFCFIRSLFRMSLYFSFVLDSSPCFVAFAPTPLPSDTDPCARCRAFDTHSFSLFVLTTGLLFAYDAAWLVASRTRLRLSLFLFLFPTSLSLRISYIVTTASASTYKYPSPALAKARQLWPPPPLSLSLVLRLIFHVFYDSLSDRLRRSRL